MTKTKYSTEYKWKKENHHDYNYSVNRITIPIWLTLYNDNNHNNDKNNKNDKNKDSNKNENNY